MKLNRTISICGTKIPAGTVLNFSTEGICTYKGRKLSKAMIAMEADGSVLAEDLVPMLNKQFPDGFTKLELQKTYGDAINGCTYAVIAVGDEQVLMLKTPNDEGIELYLIKTTDNRYKLTGEYHVASNASQGAAIEAALLTKGTLAIRGLVAHIAAVLDSVPNEDKPELTRILRVASQSVTSGSKRFLSSMNKGIVG